MLSASPFRIASGRLRDAVLETTIVGSLPKPAWLADPATLRASWRLEGDELREAMDDAVAPGDRRPGLGRARHHRRGRAEAAPLHLGLPRRPQRHRHGQPGRQAGPRRPLRRTHGRRAPGGRSDAPRRRRLRRAGALRPQAHRQAVKGHAARPDDHGRQRRRRVLPLRRPQPGDALRLHAQRRSEGAGRGRRGRHPVRRALLQHLHDRVAEWGIEALEHCMRGVTAIKAVHICYGYGVPGVLKWKTQNQDWGHYGVTLPLLAQVERRPGVGRVRGVRRRRVGAGGARGQGRHARRDRRRHRRGRDAGSGGGAHSQGAALRAPEHLLPCTDCGLVPRSRAASYGKMQALAAGAAIVRRELAG